MSQNTLVSTCRRFPVYQFLLADIKDIWIDREIGGNENRFYIESGKQYDADSFRVLFEFLAKDVKRECDYTRAKKYIFSKDPHTVKASYELLTYLSKIHGESIYPTKIYIDAARETAVKNNWSEIQNIFDNPQKQPTNDDLFSLQFLWNDDPYASIY